MLIKNVVRRSVLFLILLSLLAIPIAIDDSEASSDLLRFSEVNVYGENEGFSLYNYGTSDVNIDGFTVTDGEGTLTFSSMIVRSSSRLTITASISDDDWFSSRDNTIQMDDPKITKVKTLALNNTGDDLYLKNGSTLIDAVCYGKVTCTEGWNGEPIGISSGMYLLRTSVNDTDSAIDWIKTKPGFSNMPFEDNKKFTCEVMPFTFPESNGEPIYKAMEEADDEILISIYQLTSKNLVALLIQLEERTGDEHVDVRIILEGDVLNYDMSRELSMMRSIVNAGGEVYVINTPATDNYERYSYVHNKYAVIDGDTTIITSENWTTSNMSTDTANRGWGVLIKSTDYADYMTDIWNNDRIDTLGDVYALNDLYPDLTSYSGSLYYERPEYRYTSEWYNAQAVPVLSPDNSFKALEKLFSKAETSIFSEQLSLTSGFTTLSDESPISWMNDAANRDVHCRLILDEYTSGETAVQSVNMINATTKINACTINGGDGFGTTHNKGILIDDDITWVGSVNWTENSFKNNRESAVVIYSEEVNAYFSEFFNKDWEDNNAVEIDDLKIRMAEGEDGVYLFSVNGPDTVTYEWSLDGGDVIETTIPRILMKDLSEGSHSLTATISDTDHRSTYDFIINDANENSSSGEPNYGLIGVIVLAICGAIAALFRRGR